MSARLISVNVGMPKDVPWHGKTVHTGIFKTPVEGPVMVRRLNIDGDGQGDSPGTAESNAPSWSTRPNRMTTGGTTWAATTCSPASSGRTSPSAAWPTARLHRRPLSDRRGRVRSDPAPRHLLSRRHASGRARDPNLLVSQHRPGFYFRVITEGLVRAGDDIVLTRRGRHELSVADVDALLYLPDRDMDLLRKIVEVPALSPGWQQSFRDMLVARNQHQLPVGVDPDGGVPAATRDGHPSGEPVGDVDPARGRRWRRPSDAASRAVPHRQDPRAGDPPPMRSYSLSGDPQRVTTASASNARTTDR